MLLTPLLLLTPMVGFKYKTGSKQNNEFLLYIWIEINTWIGCEQVNTGTKHHLQK